MPQPLIVQFPGAEQTSIAEVGGKARSLIRMIEAGLPVPPGAVLTAAFFEPWLDEIKTSSTWRALVDATPEQWATLCAELKGLCSGLTVTASQRQALDELRAHVATLGDLLAVRSSSPEEDLESASFAGGYATRLGVRPDELDEAVRHCFASCLDERVLVYKREHGFDALAPRIAVIVQQQIDSDVSGVGFSLNPITNDYDEAVIDANWGLGESVVAGLATPDHFVVDKVDGRILESTPGAKQVSIRLGPDGGTVERTDHRSAATTLSDGQLHELTEVICRIETLFGAPTDIEWSYADGRLHVLQARPITTWVPLPPEMLTRPGQRRLLYMDAALSKGMTTNAPISPMGLDWMERFMAAFLVRMGRIDVTPAKGLIFAAGGRLYANLSNTMWLSSSRQMARSSAYNDALLTEILANVDAKRYRAPARPRWADARLAVLVPQLLWVLRGFLWNTLWIYLTPERAHRAYQRRIADYQRELTERLDEDLPLEELRRRYVGPMSRITFSVTMPAVLAGLASADVLYPGASGETKALTDKLRRGFTGNLVVEMGIALHRLSRMLDRSDLEDLDRLAGRIERREMPAPFLSAWDAFLVKYGCRGPLEMDPASPRYADDPRLALRQMSFMAVGADSFDPAAAHERQVEQRRHAFEALMGRSGPLRRLLLRRIHRMIELYAGTRDTPKHHIVMFICALRRRALVEGRRLVAAGRLDAPEEVFDLTFGDLALAERDPALDLRARRERRTRFGRLLQARVRHFPHVIDSRGRILRPPPRAEKPGEMTGMAVSPGRVTGPVKVLHDPHEKPVEKGDVLVAYLTDPGWTPLFVNAAAVVLEVGGILQHGAVVAREYGKPCVAGIDRVTTRLRDGQRVEVDGTAGLVRVLSHDDGPPAT